MVEIYYIEDDAVIASTVKEYLEQQGCSVSVFETLEKGKKALECHVPGIVLIDWNLPDGGGDMLCRWIRARWKELPVIFLTVRGDPCDIACGGGETVFGYDSVYGAVCTVCGDGELSGSDGILVGGSDRGSFTICGGDWFVCCGGLLYRGEEDFEV